MEIFFQLIFRVFAFVVAGWLLKKFLPEKWAATEEYFINAVYYFVIPLFIFVLIVQSTEKFNLNFSCASIMVVCGGGILSYFLALILKMPFRNVVLPVSIMNSAYLSIPVNTILFGPEGTFWAIIYNITVTIVHFTVGIMIVKKDGTAGGLWDIPSFYAVVCGIIFRFLFSDIAVFLKRIYQPLSAVVLPVMLIFIGMKVGMIELPRIKGVFLGVIFRMFGGLLLGFAAVRIFGLSGVSAGVCIITSSMPSAINTYIVARKFDADADFAAGMVLVGMAASVITIPLIFLLSPRF